MPLTHVGSTIPIPFFMTMTMIKDLLPKHVPLKTHENFSFQVSHDCQQCDAKMLQKINCFAKVFTANPFIITYPKSILTNTGPLSSISIS